MRAEAGRVEFCETHQDPPRGRASLLSTPPYPDARLVPYCTAPAFLAAGAIRSQAM